jgi:Virulence factor
VQRYPYPVENRSTSVALAASIGYDRSICCLAPSATPEARTPVTAQRIIVYWRDIPAQVIIKAGRRAEKRELPERFIQAIDASAMAIGARDSDAYLAEWRRGEPEPCSDDLAAEADAAAAALIATYDMPRLKQLIAQGGKA